MRKYSFRVACCALSLCVLGAEARAADYNSVVLGDAPKAYYQFGDNIARTVINTNIGSLGSAGNATNDLPPGIVHSIPGAIVGDPNRAAFFDFTTRTEIPFNAALNPPNTQPFTVEAWFYPASDQTGSGQAPIANRFAYSGQSRQGWVFFQRKPDASYNGSEPVGWNFRMYNNIGTSTRLDVVSLVPYRVGQWQHVVVVYDPVELTNSTVTIYIDGVAANTSTWASLTDPGYFANTDDHPGLAPANLALGNYNNANSSLNPYFGGVDEFAFYTNMLTPAQILAHYQNATNANRSLPYEALIKSDKPVAYLRLNEVAPGPDLAVNLGDLRAVGPGTNNPGVNHPVAGALKNQALDGAASYHRRNGWSVTSLPFLAQNNPDASVPFTFETWLRPLNDGQNPGASPVNNRYVSSGNRTGWVIFQRAPNATYQGVSGYSEVGWNFRMYTGSGGSGQDVITQVDYNVGEWQHLVVTWEPYADSSPALNGGTAYTGVLTAYVNGSAVASNTAAVYSANTDPTEDAAPASDLAIGAYNAASGLGSNPFEGDVDELAIYTGFVLTPEQILEHYQAGTNVYYGTNYSSLVLTAGLTLQATPGNERSGLPKTYLRFNGPPASPAWNSGTLGYLADGNQLNAPASVAGPRPPAYVGFGSGNTALSLDGTNQWASLLEPAGLEIAGQIAIEAWIKPNPTNGNPARIVSHGPLTYTVYPGGPPPTDFGAPTNGNEVFLQIEGTPGSYFYTIGSSAFTNGVGTTYHVASAPAPDSDFTNDVWVNLVGTYDGTAWRLYRNGALIATTVDPVGALTTPGADWAVGASGNGWANLFTGAIDEVAIYSSSLTARQVANHYLMGKAGTTEMKITQTGGDVFVSWPSGTTLQESAKVEGPYADVPGSPTSPMKVQAPGPKFYRWKL
jgi:hypothetical protein